MKKLLLIGLVIFISNKLQSQDLVLTNANDSLNCKITKITDDYIYFTFFNNNEVKKSLIPMKDVNTFRKEFYKETQLPTSYVKTEDDSNFRIAFKGGYSHLLAKMPDNMPNNIEEYLKDLKSGYHLGADATYFFDMSYGIGVKWNIFKTSAIATNIAFEDESGNVFYANISESRSDNFVGASFFYRNIDPIKKNAFIMGISFGYLSFADDMQIGAFPIKATGSTFGMDLDMFYDVNVSENLYLGFGLSVKVGALSELEFSNGISSYTEELAEGEYESMSRIDLSVTISFGN